MKTPLLFLMLLLPFCAMSQGVATRSTNGLAKGLTIIGTTTNLAVGFSKIIGTGPQGQERGAVLSGLTWDGTTLALYSAPTIVSFTNNQNVLETGAETSGDTVLGWTLGGGAITSQSITPDIGSLAIGLRTYNDNGTYTVNRTYTLTVADGTTTNTSTTSITFRSKAYWGASSDPTPDDAALLAMSQEFATGLARTKSITVNGEHIIVAYPATFGLANFRVNGFTDTAWVLEVRNVTNASGATVSYNVYHSTEPGLGTFTVEAY